MQHALYVPPFACFGDVHFLVDFACVAEEAGWDGVFLWDHILYEDDVPFVDAWIAMAAIAAATSRLRIGPLITPLPRRRPQVVAREAVTLDHLSHGRLTLGVGLGIDFWREFGAFGEAAEDDAARARLLDDGIEILRGLLSGEEFSYAGETASVDRVRFLPKPVQQPSIPIWSAVTWLPAREGPVRRAARLDGVMPFNPSGPMTPDIIRELRDRIAAVRGNDSFDICSHGPREQVAEFEAAGVTWFCDSLYWESRDDAMADARTGPPR